MRNVFALVLAFLSCAQAMAQQLEKPKTSVQSVSVISNQMPAGLSKNDSLAIANILSVYSQLESNIEIAFGKIFQELQAQIDQLNNSINNLNSENKVLQLDIVDLYARLNSQKARLDSIASLFNIGNSNVPLLESQSQLISQTEAQLKSKNDKVAENKLQIAQLQGHVKAVEQSIVTLKIDKQNALAEIAKQKQKALQEALQLAGQQSKNFSRFANRELEYSKLWMADSMRLIRKRYVH
jgi:chromosome segregation ATPase